MFSAIKKPMILLLAPILTAKSCSPGSTNLPHEPSSVTHAVAPNTSLTGTTQAQLMSNPVQKFPSIAAQNTPITPSYPGSKPDQTPYKNQENKPKLNQNSENSQNNEPDNELNQNKQNKQQNKQNKQQNKSDYESDSELDQKEENTQRKSNTAKKNPKKNKYNLIQKIFGGKQANDTTKSSKEQSSSSTK